MKLWRLISDYRWPIYIAGHLTMSIVACAVLVYVATRPDVPRPIDGYYQAAQAWDADEAVAEASRALGWQVTYELPADVPVEAGMPRPVDVRVIDRSGEPVAGLSGRFVALRPSDSRLNQAGDLSPIPAHAGIYRTLVRLDAPGTWDFHIDANQQAMRFVHAARIIVPAAMKPDGRRRP
jgi:nitrogen fixation protein FixH